MTRAARSLIAAFALLLPAGCTDTGPVTEAQIGQDIRAEAWMRSFGQRPPTLPGTPPGDRTGGESRWAIP